MQLSVPVRGAYSRMEGSAWVNARVSGILSLDLPTLVLQVREQRQRVAMSTVPGPGGTGIMGDEATTTTRIPLDDLVAIEFRRPWLLTAQLVITVRRLELLDPFRWADGARLKLSVRLRDRAAAREFALVTSTALLDRDLARLERPAE